MPIANTVDSFWSKVEKTDTCWIWKTGTNSRGYGIFSIKCKKYFAHRFSYKLKHGYLPKDKQIMHSCDVRRCVNPDHLSAGTNSDNQQDMVRKGRHSNSQKTHCIRGHKFTEINTSTRKLPSGNLGRVCRTCTRLRWGIKTVTKREPH